MSLTSKQRKDLKGRAHHLKPVIRIGQHGVSEGVIEETRQALHTHELIKVQIQQGDREQRTAAAALLAEKTESELVGEIGRICILYRERDEA
jgi:RNA-binding protein